MPRHYERKSLRRFIFFWMSGLVVCFTVMALALVLSTRELQSITARILIDSEAVEAAHRLENSILEERREDLLLRAGGVGNPAARKHAAIERAWALVENLGDQASSPEEEAMVAGIRREFARYSLATSSGTPGVLGTVSALSDSLLGRIEKFRDLNRFQMLGSITESSRLDARVNHWTLILIVMMSVSVVVGALVLVHRIVQPTSEVIRAARSYGEGAFESRARVFREDELGMLSRTFNDMAGSIRNFQNDRLTFAAAVAHDLKNPLVTVGAAARLLRKGQIPEPEQAEWLERIVERVDYLENMIQDLMLALQADSGNLELNIGEFDLSALTRTFFQRQKESHQSHALTLEAEPDCRVLGDPRRLERVIANIVGNAVKYSPDGSSIRLRLLRQGRNALIAVEDQGVGIAEDEIKQLFKPFKRLGEGRTLIPGNGLGLFSAHRIVDLHGGRISIRSRKGEGTTVEITLPLARPKPLDRPPARRT